MNDLESPLGAASPTAPHAHADSPPLRAPLARSNGRWRDAWAETRMAALAGAFLWLSFGIVDHPGLGRGLAFALCGSLHGIAVHGLLRLFPVRRWALPLAGLLCGPVPLAAVLALGRQAEERGGVLVLAALIGLWIGLLEAARRTASES